MLTTNYIVLDDLLMLQELEASLFYHPFMAQVPRDAMCSVADALTNAHINSKSFEDALDDATQALLADNVVTASHAGDEVAAIAYGMVQRINEVNAFACADSKLDSSALIF
jgi:hypothetical protein